MARYVLSHRRAGIFDDSEKRAVREQADRAFSSLFAANADVVGRSEPKEETKRETVIFDASPAEVDVKRAELSGDVLLEPEIVHYRDTTRPLDLAPTDREAAGEVLAGTGETLRLTVRGPSGPLPGAEVLLFLRDATGEANRLESATDASGEVAFQFGSSWSAAAALVLPANHWSLIVRGPTDGMTVEVIELPATAPTAWWHRVLGHGAIEEAGNGVRVGVADTGLGPHPHLAHATSVGAFVDGDHDEGPSAGHDVDSHGTHVCGTIGARTPADARYAGGVAPGVDLFAARVFPDRTRGANQGDIANAIDHLSKERQVDLINLSLGAPSGSEIERDAIEDALERGTLCVCAAGNSNGPVEFPAAFPETVAVGALGLEGWGASGSLSATRYPDRADHFGATGLYRANFSCFGAEVDCAAPGVGIVAPVPEHDGLVAPYTEMDGTSMASPDTVAALALALSATPDYLALPRDLTRSSQARAVLAFVCRNIGLAPELQGDGVPWAGLARYGQG